VEDLLAKMIELKLAIIVAAGIAVGDVRYSTQSAGDIVTSLLLRTKAATAFSTS